MEYISNSEQDTKNIGKELTKNLQGGDILCLYGDLGAGKTALTKGIAEGLGIKEDITSPTFTLMNIYLIKNSKLKTQKLVHIDTYRLENEKQLVEIGAEDYLGAPDTVCVIEWPEKIEGLLIGKVIKTIQIKNQGQDERKIIAD